MLYKIRPPAQRPAQLLLLPPQPVIQQQLGIGKYTRVEQRGLAIAKEPRILA